MILLEKYRKANLDIIGIEILILNENGKNGLLVGRWLIHENDYRKNMILGRIAEKDMTLFIL